MSTNGISERSHSTATAGASPLEGELVLVRSDAWRLLIPLRFVQGVFEAALPAALPGAAHPVVAIRGRVLPLLFCAVLLGADRVAISAADKMVLLQDGARGALLHVQAVEDVLPFAPVPSEAEPPVPRELVAGYSQAPRPLAVLDVPALLERATP